VGPHTCCLLHRHALLGKLSRIAAKESTTSSCQSLSCIQHHIQYPART
jgi:hypothetical protein